MNKAIGILGCGWLGLPLATQLIAKGYTVYGTTTSKLKLGFLAKEGIHPFQITFTESEILGDIKDFLAPIETLIINIPPKLRSNPQGNFVAKIRLLQQEIQASTIQNVLFVSSTSVYGHPSEKITETTAPNPTTASGKQLLEAEEILANDSSFKTTVVRFGGLIGPERNPIKMLSGKENLKNGEQAVNLIHLDDCIHLLSTILQKGYWGEVFNGVFPLHPSKKAYYTAQAKQKEITPPEYERGMGSAKNRIIESTNFYAKGHSFKKGI